MQTYVKRIKKKPEKNTGKKKYPVVCRKKIVMKKFGCQIKKEFRLFYKTIYKIFLNIINQKLSFSFFFYYNYANIK